MSAEETLLPSVYTPSPTAPTHPSGQSNAFKPLYCLSHWPSTNFILAAGTATFQPSTAKVVLIEDVSRRIPNTPRERWFWFLPRGRKDQGETLEQCAVRETLEEAGYTATLTRSPTLQPKGPGTGTTHIEAFHMQLLPRLRRRRQAPVNASNMELYLAFWYLCTIPYDAVRDEDYGAHFVGAHERAYNSELVDIAEAIKLLSGGKFEYHYTRTESGDGIQGSMVDEETGHMVHWEDVAGGDCGGVEALIVALGWEWICAASEPVEDTMSRLEV